MTLYTIIHTDLSTSKSQLALSKLFLPRLCMVMVKIDFVGFTS